MSDLDDIHTSNHFLRTICAPRVPRVILSIIEHQQTYPNHRHKLFAACSVVWVVRFAVIITDGCLDLRIVFLSEMNCLSLSLSKFSLKEKKHCSRDLRNMILEFGARSCVSSQLMSLPNSSMRKMHSIFPRLL